MTEAYFKALSLVNFLTKNFKKINKRLRIQKFSVSHYIHFQSILIKFKFC
jgi:hypothetical protein